MLQDEIIWNKLNSMNLLTAITRYGELMNPLYEITEKLSLPHSNKYKNYVEKETAKNADELLSFWNKPLY